MLLLNDTKAVEFSKRFNPEMVELHSVCLNVPRIQSTVLKNVSKKAKVVIGVGGCTIKEVEEAVKFFHLRETVLMFGFQNYPTKYEDVNLGKIRKIQAMYPGHKFGYADHTGWDEPNNELITLLVSANGMSFIEKHVTTNYGKQRIDYSAAISIEMFNSLNDKIKILKKVKGDGLIKLNNGEKSYSQYGPMKMAAIANADFEAGHVLLAKDISFRRTKEKTKMSQIDAIDVIGTSLANPISKNDIFDWFYFSETK
jgi:N,N'-diacetyllegionaminate synthase